MTIPTKALGRTGVEVPILGYGAMELRGPDSMGGPAISDEDAGHLLNEVLDAGVNLIDTSIDYGRSEELIGRYRSSRRDEFFLASKCGCPLVIEPGWDPPTVGAAHDYTPVQIRMGVEHSLRRLRTDHLNLVQVHMSPTRTQMESDGTIGELEQLRAEGKVQLIGMSGTLPTFRITLRWGPSTCSRSRTRRSRTSTSPTSRRRTDRCGHPHPRRGGPWDGIRGQELERRTP